MNFQKALLTIFLFGSIGSLSELLLLDHTEDSWQLLPLVMIGTGLIMIVLKYLLQSPLILKIFRIMMILFMLSGLLGIWLHFEGNLEFILEMYPSESGFTLFWKTIKGATPVLAPGTMALLGMIGYLYTINETDLKQD